MKQMRPGSVSKQNKKEKIPMSELESLSNFSPCQLAKLLAF